MQRAWAMMHDIKLEVVRRACDIAGGSERLSERLGVEIHTIRFWLAGRATPPESAFLRLVDIVLEDDIARAAQDRRRNVTQRKFFGDWPRPPAEQLPRGST